HFSSCWRKTCDRLTQKICLVESRWVFGLWTSLCTGLERPGLAGLSSRLFPLSSTTRREPPLLDHRQPQRAAEALRHFVETPLDQLLAPAEARGEPRLS